MNSPEDSVLRFSSVRSLVRYVDEELAVVEARFSLREPMAWPGDALPGALAMHMRIESAEGFNDEQISLVRPENGQGFVRFELVSPQRWWPVGMGDQDLYTVRLSLLHNDEIADQHEATVGLTSVRSADRTDAIESSRLLVNGQECPIDDFITVDAPDERMFLPVGGQSVLLVRGHYGPNVLYDAADRAGILMIQCVPIDPAGCPDATVAQEVDRLAGHPSLAGWYIGHLGPAVEELYRRIRQLDPTRSVFRQLPQTAA